MRLIKTPMTLSQYEAKYPNYQTTLLSFSDKEIKEFNDKFYKNNGSKNIPDKYALLEKYKWVHIKDRYYQIPRISKLGKVGLISLATISVATGIALPIILNSGENVTVTEDEFKNSLLYLADNPVRKFVIDHSKATSKFIMPDIPEQTEEETFTLEVDGLFEKYTSHTKTNSGDEDIPMYIRNDRNNKLLYVAVPKIISEEEYEYHWRRANPSKGALTSNVFTVAYSTYADNFSKFSKSNRNTYSAKNMEVPTYIGYLPEADIKGISNVDLTFGKDKSIKSIKEEITIDLSEYMISGASIKLYYEFAFKEVTTHVISDIPEWSDDDPDDVYELSYNEQLYQSESIQYLPEDVATTFTLTTVNMVPAELFYIGYQTYDENINGVGYLDFSKIENISVQVLQGQELVDVAYQCITDNEGRNCLRLDKPIIGKDITLYVTVNGLENNYDGAFAMMTAQTLPESNYTLDYDVNTGEYSTYPQEAIKEEKDYTFEVRLKNQQNIKYFEIGENFNRNNKQTISKINKISIDGTEIEGTNYSLSSDNKTIIFANEVIGTTNSKLVFDLKVPSMNCEAFEAVAYKTNDIELSYSDNVYKSFSQNIKSGHYNFKINLNGTNNVETVKIVDSIVDPSINYEFSVSKAYVGTKEVTGVINNNVFEFDEPVTGTSGDILTIEATYKGDEIGTCYVVGESGETPTPIQTYNLDYNSGTSVYELELPYGAIGRNEFDITILEGCGIQYFYLLDGNDKKMDLKNYVRSIKDENGNDIHYVIKDNTVMFDSSITTENSKVKITLFSDCDIYTHYVASNTNPEI